MKKLTFAAASALLVLLSACSQAPQTAQKKEPAPPPEPVTGQSALYKMYQVARGWAGADIEVLKMNSIPLPDIKPEPGKSGAWQATFVSASKGRARSYTYSIIEGEGNLHKGVFAGLEEGWSGPRGVTKPFPIIAVKVDTDAAYKTAFEKGKDYDKKNPGKPISVLLEKNNKFPDPSWRIIWGESVGTSNFSVFVDASTGGFQETMR
jgi:hypothetical protein